MQFFAYNKLFKIIFFADEMQMTKYVN